MLSLSERQMEALAREAVRQVQGEDTAKAREAQLEQARSRLKTLDKVAAKLYTDNAEGRLDDERLRRMMDDLERESAGLKARLHALSQPDAAQQTEQNYARFFALARQYTHVETLTREILQTFIERIEVGPRERISAQKPPAPQGRAYRQSVRIIYRLIGELPAGASENGQA